MTDPQGGTAPPAFLKAWDDYVAASHAVFERLRTSATLPGAATSLPFLGAWQEFAHSLGMRSDPADMLSGLAPKVGYTREYQAVAQRMAELAAQFQRRYTEFLQQHAGISEQAFHAIQERTASDAGLAKSPSAIYEAWIDSAEQAYSQAAHGETFSRSLGELCNLLSAFKVERGRLLEALARHLDLPSRAEVDSLHRQVHELRNAARAASPAPGPRRSKARKPRKPAGK